MPILQTVACLEGECNRRRRSNTHCKHLASIPSTQVFIALLCTRFPARICLSDTFFFVFVKITCYWEGESESRQINEYNLMSFYKVNILNSRMDHSAPSLKMLVRNPHCAFRASEPRHDGWQEQAPFERKPRRKWMTHFLSKIAMMWKYLLKAS